MRVETLKTVDIKVEELSSISGTHKGKERTNPGKVVLLLCRCAVASPLMQACIYLNTGVHSCVCTHIDTHTHFKEYFN